MKKYAIIILSIILAINCFSFTTFADENQGGDPPSSPNMPASIDFEQSYFNAAGGISVYAGNSFNIDFTFNVGSHTGGTATATVSGTGFSVNYISADVPITPNVKQSLSVKADRDITTGRHTLTVVVKYILDGVTYSYSRDLNIDATGITEPETPETPEAPEGTVSLTIISAPEEEIMPGETFKVSFRTSLNNVYSQYYGYYYQPGAEGTVTISGEGFSLAGALAEQEISVGNSTIEVLCDPEAPRGRKTLTLTVTFTVDGKEYTASRTLNIDVFVDEEEIEEIDESKEKASFTLVSASIPEGKGRTNLSTKLSVEFKNNTEYVAKNLKIKITGFEGVILNTYTDTAEAGDIEGGKTVKAAFPIKFVEEPPEQPKLMFELTYDSITEPVTETFNVYLQATPKPKDEDTQEEKKDSLRPKVIVSNFSVDTEDEEERIFSGEEFTLKIVLQNTSAEKDLRNMTVNVTPGASYTSGGTGTGTSGGPVFSFVDGTSSFYTETFEKNSTKEYVIKLKCSASAGAGTYPIDITFDYQFENNDIFDKDSGSLSINLPVNQPIKFDLMDWEPPTECGPDGVSLSFQYFNKSKNPMTALGISVEGDFEMDTQYPGSLAASSYEYFEGVMTPVDPDAVGETKNAVLVFTFEDSAGAEQQITYEFPVKIVEESTLGGGDMNSSMGMGMGMEIEDPGFGVVDPNMGGNDIEYDENGDPVSSDNVEEGGLPLWAKIAIPSGVGVVVIIAVVVIAKKVKAKRELEDEDDE